MKGRSHLTPKASNSIAGGNATGTQRRMVPTLQGSKTCSNATLSGSEWGSLSIPVALPPAIEFVASGDMCGVQALAFLHHVRMQEHSEA